VDALKEELEQAFRRAAEDPTDPLKAIVLRWGGLAGAADLVVEAGARAARERGDFESCLMRCREVQESLAALVSRADLVRLGAGRISLLLERGDRERAALESGRIDAQASGLAAAVRTAALALLGEAWVGTHLDADGAPSAGERTSA
jgi:hypothetical protein